MAASKVCPSCGAVNSPSNLFCIHCGRSFAAPGAPPTAVPSPYPYPPAYPAGPPPTAPPPAGVYPYLGPPPRRANFSSFLSGMFDVWTRGFKEFFLVFLVIGLANGVVSALLTFAFFGTFAMGSGFFPTSPPSGLPSVNPWDLILFGILVSVAGAIIGSLFAGGMTEYAVRRFRGEAISLERSLRRGLEKFLSILGATFLLNLLVYSVISVPVLLILPLGFTGGTVDPGSAIALICGALALLVVGGILVLYLTVAMSLYAPAIMMENANAVGGLSRSWRITKGHWWSLFGAFLVAEILGFVIILAITVPLGFLDIPAVSIAASAVAAGIVGAWVVILPAVAYDLILREPTYYAPPYYPGPGYPGPWQAPAMGTGPPPQPPSSPPTPPSGPGGP